MKTKMFYFFNNLKQYEQRENLSIISVSINRLNSSIKKIPTGVKVKTITLYLM